MSFLLRSEVGTITMSREPGVVARKPSKEGLYSKHTQEYDLGSLRRQSYIPPKYFFFPKGEK